MTKSNLVKTTLIATTLTLSSFSFAESHSDSNKATSEKQAATAVTFRKSLLQLVRSNMGPLGAMAKGNIPMNADTIALNAQRIEFLGGMMHDYFALNTTGFDVDTKAKDIIWQEQKDFASKADDMVSAAANLQEIVANNEESEFRRGIGKLGSTCKACHDKFKED